MRMKRTKTAGTRVMCLRIQMGAMSPSGYSGEEGVKGESGEWAPVRLDWLFSLPAGIYFRGGKRTSWKASEYEIFQ